MVVAVSEGACRVGSPHPSNTGGGYDRSVSIQSRHHALVLGGGIQGMSTAFAMTEAGWSVTVIDRLPLPLMGTSLRGEGKLHLGYVYGNDPSRATAALMLEGALAFAETLERWLPAPLAWDLLRSEPFLYAVLPDSMVGVEALAGHYAWVDDVVVGRFAAGASYAGKSEFRPVELLRPSERHGFVGDVQAVFKTSEVAVDPELLRESFLAGTVERGVSFLGNTTVHAVERAEHGFRVSCTNSTGATVSHRADVVINCLWDGRLAIDATLGIRPSRPWSYRLKYAVHGTLPGGIQEPPSVTYVLGPFGDVVRRASGRIYASWYPECLAGWSDELVVPPEWRPALDSVASEPMRRDVATRTLRALSRLVPALSHLRVDMVTAGVIVAWGDTDIDQLDSELHRRDAIGVHAHDGYFSVDTGKLTTAPLFAQRVADMLAQ